MPMPTPPRISPKFPELFAVEVVDDEVGGAVEADEEVRDADQHVDGIRHPASGVAELGAPNHLVQIWREKRNQ